MPFADINGARLYYETFGHDTPGQAPIVLIHGSTSTGSSNWSLVAPLLARAYRVIVPDCRGHGRSDNPTHSYSFGEMAADTAALIRALGYETAHVIGHSNGGNVALVTLVEHPGVVQTVVLQAANAYVSPDLVEREPAIFDPERVARENPRWMHEMIALHGEQHGVEYWRDLLALTVAEILAGPNYTPADLTAVERPTLVIQGENDQVNAPARHAQFIAHHIPDAELWLPSGAGHNVQDDELFRWVETVLDFLRRRGDGANDALYRLGRARYADRRDWVFDLRAGQGDGGQVLSGRVLAAEQLRAARDLLPGAASADRVTVLLSETTPWALAQWPVADLRAEPSSRAERVSQIVFGEAVRVLEEYGEWALVRLERDGYLGWARGEALHRCDAAGAASYAAACDSIVVADLARAYPAPRAAEAASVGKLPFGAVVAVAERRDGWAAVRLPDGRLWWCAAADLLPLPERPRADTDGIDRALALLRRFAGVPYLWGGRSPFGYDCSGLAQTFMSLLGIQTPRDADQQARVGAPVEGILQPGDLLFFGRPRDDVPGGDPVAERKIVHVAISLGGDEIIHANSDAGGVAYNSLDPSSPRFRPWLREAFAGARRYV